jgi:hypothetical protein
MTDATLLNPDATHVNGKGVTGGGGGEASATPQPASSTSPRNLPARISSAISRGRLDEAQAADERSGVESASWRGG